MDLRACAAIPPIALRRSTSIALLAQSSWRTSQCSRVLLDTFFRALGQFWIQDTDVRPPFSAAIGACSTAKITSALAAKLSSR